MERKNIRIVYKYEGNAIYRSGLGINSKEVMSYKQLCLTFVERCQNCHFFAVETGDKMWTRCVEVVYTVYYIRYYLDHNDLSQSQVCQIPISAPASGRTKIIQSG